MKLQINNWHVCAHTCWIQHVCPPSLFFYSIFLFTGLFENANFHISSFFDSWGNIWCRIWPFGPLELAHAALNSHSYLNKGAFMSVASVGKWIGHLWFRWNIICHQTSTIMCQAQPTTLTGGLASISWQRVWAPQIWTEIFLYIFPEGNIWLKNVVQHVFHVRRCVNIFQEQFSTACVRLFETQGQDKRLEIRCKAHTKF